MFVNNLHILITDERSVTKLATLENYKVINNTKCDGQIPECRLKLSSIIRINVRVRLREFKEIIRICV